MTAYPACQNRRTYRTPYQETLLSGYTLDFHVKEKLLRTTRNPDQYPQPYATLAFFGNLSKYTMLQRKNLATITKPLIITKDNKSYSVRNLDEGLLLLRQWHILESLEQRQHDRNHSDEMTT